MKSSFSPTVNVILKCGIYSSGKNRLNHTSRNFHNILEEFAVYNTPQASKYSQVMIQEVVVSTFYLPSTKIIS